MQHFFSTPSQYFGTIHQTLSSTIVTINNERFLSVVSLLTRAGTLTIFHPSVRKCICAACIHNLRRDEEKTEHAVEPGLSVVGLGQIRG